MKLGSYEVKPVLMDLPDDAVWKQKCDDAIEYFGAKGIREVERVHCIHGKSWKVGPSPENIYLLDGRPEEKFCIGQNKVSNFLSHILVLNVCLRMPYDHFLLLEEDAEFVEDWIPRTEQCLNDLKQHDPDWDLFYIGSCCARDKRPQQIAGELHHWPYLGDEGGMWTMGPQCNHAWIVAKKSIPIILATQHDTSSPWDASMLKHTGMYLKTYGAIPRLAGQRNTKLWE